MLSLTPAQKERLEDHLSRMSMKEQNEFLTHQQNLNKRIQQVQQEHQQKLRQQQQQKQQQELLKQQQQQQHSQAPTFQSNQQSAVPMTTTATPSTLRLPNQKLSSGQHLYQAVSQQLHCKQQQQQPSSEPAASALSVSEPAASSALTSALPTTVEVCQKFKVLSSKF